jgi:hypothetical protein
MTDTTQTLATALLEEFVTELVNLPLGGPNSDAAFVRRFADFGLLKSRTITVFDSPQEKARALTVPYLHQIFRAIWIEPDAKTRQWGAMILRVEWCEQQSPEHGLSFSKQDGVMRIPPPLPETGIERALEFLLRHHRLTRYCQNAECPAPYFFAKKSSQRYCSEDCAQTAERETKRKWWTENGPAWRKKRKKTATGTRKAAKKKGR